MLSFRAAKTARNLSTQHEHITISIEDPAEG
jgi:hypothetical protein